MYYCKSGDLLKINALVFKNAAKFFKFARITPFVNALHNGEMVEIPHGDLVLSLESSVPPWYEEEYILCLWSEQKVHIPRKALEHFNKA